jgi:hypothetical protein
VFFKNRVNSSYPLKDVLLDISVEKLATLAYLSVLDILFHFRVTWIIFQPFSNTLFISFKGECWLLKI